MNVRIVELQRSTWLVQIVRRIVYTPYPNPLAVGHGCSNAQSTDVSTDTGAFNQIIDGVDEMHTDINSDLYSGDELCGDMLSNTVVYWVESCEGTELEADAKTLLERFVELDTLQYGGGSRDELKSKVQEISDVVVALQEKR